MINISHACHARKVNAALPNYKNYKLRAWKSNGMNTQQSNSTTYLPLVQSQYRRARVLIGGEGEIARGCAARPAIR